MAESRISKTGLGGGSANPKGGKVGIPDYYFDNFFLENYMKKKEIGPGRGASLALPLDPPMLRYVYSDKFPIHFVCMKVCKFKIEAL